MVGPNLDQVNAQILAKFPNYRVTYKANSWLMKAINVVLLIFTLGAAKTFMTAFVTTINNTVYVPSTWDTWSIGAKCVTLRHESIHMQQAKKLTFFLFALLYVLLPLPLGLAYFRAKFEEEAYTETLRAWNEYGADIKQAGFRADIIVNFTSSAYGWMWPFSKNISAWYDKAAATVLAGG